MTGSVTLLDASNQVVGTFTTIQSAVNAASDGYTIELASNFYDEQVLVNGLKNLTIEGVGQGLVIPLISSPLVADLVPSFQNPDEQAFPNQMAVVGLENGASVTLKNLSVNGRDQGHVPAGSDGQGGFTQGELVGIEALNSSLTLNGVSVLFADDLTGGVLQGDPRNVGILVDDRNGSAQSFTMTGSNVNFFQKAGVLAEGAGLTVDLDANNIDPNPNGGTITQSLIELDAGATGTITNNFLGVIGANATGIRAYRAGSGITVSGNFLNGKGGTGMAFVGTNAPVATSNSLSGLNLGIADDFAGIGFGTALEQSLNSTLGDVEGYYFHPDPSSTTPWNVTGANGSDDLEGGVGNDVFQGGRAGSIFVGHGGIDTVLGIFGDLESPEDNLAIQGGKWVDANGAATETYVGIEKVGIGSRIFDLADRLGANIGGFQGIQAAIDAAHSGDVVFADIGPGPTSARVTTDNLTFEPSQDSTGITLTLGSGVRTITLSDQKDGRAAGQAPSVTVIANGLHDTFSGTAADLDGDTLSGLKFGDKITVINANTFTLTFDFSGTTLRLDSATLTLTNAQAGGRFLETPGQLGTVDLTLISAAPILPTNPDFDGDSKADIVWQSDDGHVWQWLMNGASVTSSNDLGNTGNSTWHVATTGDFNGDGKADILWQNADGHVWESQMSGAQTNASIDMGNAGEPAWHVVTTGDFNGDGKSDILWQNDDGHVWESQLNGGQVTSSLDLGNAENPAWHVVATGDFNGDGKSDILWQNGNGDVWLSDMNGAAVIGSFDLGNAGNPSWHVVATGDFNDDGHADILWQNDSGHVWEWLMNNAQVISSNDLGNDGNAAWHIVRTGDYNGDGKSDILWQNDDGHVWQSQMDGAAVIGSNDLGNAGNPSWHVLAAHS